MGAAERSPDGRAGPVYLTLMPDDEVPLAALRGVAGIKVEFESGSARPVVGRTVLLAKRLQRRSLRWYVTPMMEQQSKFNQSLLDALEVVVRRLDGLDDAIAALADQLAAAPPTAAPGPPAAP